MKMMTEICFKYINNIDTIMYFFIEDSNDFESSYLEDFDVTLEASKEEPDWSDSNDSDDDSWGDNKFNEEFIDTDYFDNKVEPSTIMDHDSERSQYADVDEPKIMKDEEGTETVEFESFTGWDDLF